MLCSQLHHGSYFSRSSLACNRCWKSRLEAQTCDLLEVKLVIRDCRSQLSTNVEPSLARYKPLKRHKATRSLDVIFSSIYTSSKGRDFAGTRPAGRAFASAFGAAECHVMSMAFHELPVSKTTSKATFPNVTEGCSYGESLKLRHEPLGLGPSSHNPWPGPCPSSADHSNDKGSTRIFL